MKTKFVFVLALFISVQGLAFAFPESKGFVDHSQSSFQFQVLANYQGIVKLNDCSGSIVRFEDSKPTDLAILMTNGHCHPYGVGGGMIPPNKATINLPFERKALLMSPDLKKAVAGVVSTRVIYSTMTGTDITLYELKESYTELFQKYAVSPLKIATTHAQVGTPMAVVSGYWERTYDCTVEKIVPILKEADWVSTESIRYSQECHTVGGTSGSPVVSKTTGEIIGINNTGNDDGEECTMDNPCEMDADGRNVVILKGRGYGQKTSDLYTCRVNGLFDFTAPTCKLFHN